MERSKNQGVGQKGNRSAIRMFMQLFLPQYSAASFLPTLQHRLVDWKLSEFQKQQKTVVAIGLAGVYRHHHHAK